MLAFTFILPLHPLGRGHENAFLPEHLLAIERITINGTNGLTPTRHRYKKHLRFIYILRMHVTANNHPAGTEAREARGSQVTTLGGMETALSSHVLLFDTPLVPYLRSKDLTVTMQRICNTCTII
ncbi:hypothetical protein GGTG_06626 [Gaeumannomyces tritici R3-111a-1]|uniref:Uncharacterized protein n=1 Tax=Gaeumannomyces tritici (strain R3-111a-1) TaxID=644352 RepID=J3NZC7_GAET3|nr:hypothetical protein GGTG_06626 [Gaeumannomyces tritici R3-111a-1]EJT76710.1 hypothetical protein GGTG_06626 [Gaeumannomyces tritici R3-111a-1]